MNSARSFLQRVGSCRSGGAAIETATILPFFILLLAGLFDFGSSVMNAMALEAAARAGAQYALTQPTDAAGISAVIQAATRLDASTLTVTSSNACECPNGTTGIDCSTGTCGAGVILVRIVTIQVTQPFTSLLPYPAFMRPTQLTGTAVIRVT
jgi:Flp pilus assembly protein TadG